ncbi:unnamed protein product, partial [Rotaria sp. Silwood1]
KLNIESKIISITTDGGSDIKATTSSYKLDLRFSCDPHNINRIISTGVGLWKISISQSKKKTAITTAINASSNDSEDELEGICHTNYDPTSDEWFDDDENESDSYSDRSDDDSTYSQSQL